MLQQNWYNDGNRYLKWINNNKDKMKELKLNYFDEDIFTIKDIKGISIINSLTGITID